MKIDSKKLNKAKLARALLSLTAVAVALILAISVGLNRTFGWFASNKNVSGVDMSVSVSPNPYELSVSSTLRADAVKYYDMFLDKFGFDIDNTDGLMTTPANTAIKWVMSNEAEDKLLMPGAYGTLTFSVIPAIAGDLTLHFDLILDPYFARFFYLNGKLNPVSFDAKTLKSLKDIKADALNEVPANTLKAAECQSAMDYLSGHILFFESRDSNLLYSNRIDTESGFTRTFTVAESDIGQPQEVTIYWIWPNTFTQIELDVSFSDPAMFSESQAADNSNQTPREELLAYIEQNSDKFFDFAEPTYDLTSLLTLNDPDDIITLSNGYNNADQIIGDNIRLVLVSLTSNLIEGTD